RTVDAVAPGVTLATTAGDPTNLAALPFTATFTEDVTGFTASDVVVVNATVAGFKAVDAHTYTFDVVPTADGRVTVYVPAGGATDAAGNTSAASNTLSRTYNGPVATPAVTTSANNPTNLAVIPFTVTFSQDVTGFDATDLQVANGTASNFAAVDAHTFT